MKTLRNKKALSPVVASIILIAVTVAVSIAVAAWMGALSVGFMGSSSVTITNVEFLGEETDKYIELTVNNTGTKKVTITTVKVNGVRVTTEPISLEAGAGDTLDLDVEWIAGQPYKFDLFDNSGQILGSYQATAPA